MQRSSRHVLLLTVLISMVLTVPAQASGGTSDLESLSFQLEEETGLVASARLQGTPVARGVVRQHGEDVPAVGVTVTLMAWPNEETLAAMHVGDPLALTPIAVTQTDRAGRYALRIDPKVRLEHLTSGAGTLDVDVVAVSANQAATYSFSLVPHDETANRASDGTVDTDPFTAAMHDDGSVVEPFEVDLELGNAAGAALPLGALDDHLDTGPEDAAREQQMTTSSVTPGRCPGGTGLKKKYSNRRVRVSAIHIQGSGKQMQFKYASDASSTLGVGVSATGASGTYSAGGTVQRTRSVGTTFGAYTSAMNVFLDTHFDYGKYCVAIVGGGYHYYQYQTRAISHVGGGDWEGAVLPSISASNCVPYNSVPMGSEQKSTTAVTHTAGAKLNGVIGINLSSRTGFTTKAKTSWYFTQKGRACGTHGKPLSGTPRRIVLLNPA